MKAKLIAIFLLLVIGLIMYISCNQTKVQDNSSTSKFDSSVFDTNQLKDYFFDHSKISDNDTSK